MKIAVIGADGQLGTDLCKVIPNKDLIPLTIKDIDITVPVKTDQVLDKYAPQVLINTAAYHRVDDCEDNPDLALKVNSLGVRNLALSCRKLGMVLVHISTDYVFDGEKGSPYSEEDTPRPCTAYGISKLGGEYFVSYLAPKHFIVRSSGLYGAAGCMGKGGANFVENIIKKSKTMKEIKVVSDEVISPTYTYDLAAKIYELILTDAWGLYHITNSGSCSWFEFSKKIFELLKINSKIIETSSADYKTKARRPKFSALDNANLRKLGIKGMRSWEEALAAYLKEKGYRIASE